MKSIVTVCVWRVGSRYSCGEGWESCIEYEGADWTSLHGTEVLARKLNYRQSEDRFLPSWGEDMSCTSQLIPFLMYWYWISRLFIFPNSFVLLFVVRINCSFMRYLNVYRGQNTAFKMASATCASFLRGFFRRNVKDDKVEMATVLKLQATNSENQLLPLLQTLL